VAVTWGLFPSTSGCPSGGRGRGLIEENGGGQSARVQAFSPKRLLGRRGSELRSSVVVLGEAGL